ncbi:MAG: response regulator, partial [Craterilacuibacter sp.]
ARVQLARRDSVAATKTLAGLRRDYKHDDAGNWMADVIDSQLQQQAGNRQKAALLLASAEERLAALDDKLGVEARMEYARACYSQGRADLGDKVARMLVRNHHDDEALLEALGNLFDQAGRSEAGRELIAENVQSVVNLNNIAVREAQAGHYEQAVALFGKAYAELPDNVQVMLNMSNAIIALVYRQGWHESHVRSGHAMLMRVRALQPSSSKFQKILQAWNSLMEQQGKREWLV